MTSRRKTKKNSNEAAEAKETKRRGGGEGVDGVVTPETGRSSRRRGRTATPPTPSKTPDSPPRKTRRSAASPSTPKRVSPRGRGAGKVSPTKESPVNSTPRGRGQRLRRGSTDSSASSVGAASVASSSTPTRRRGRRGSNSSEASAASETPQKTTASLPERRKKRGKSKSPPAVLVKKTNGTSPQPSPKRQSKRRKYTKNTDASPTANGQGSHKTSGRRGASEISQEDQDGETEDPGEKSLSNIGNGSPSSSADFGEDVKDGSTPSITSEELAEDRTQSPVENSLCENEKPAEACNEVVEESGNTPNKRMDKESNTTSKSDLKEESSLDDANTTKEKPELSQNGRKEETDKKLEQCNKESKELELQKSEEEQKNDAPLVEVSIKKELSNSDNGNRVKRKMNEEEGDVLSSGIPETLPTSHKKHKVDSVDLSVTKCPQAAHVHDSVAKTHNKSECTDVPSDKTHIKDTSITKQHEVASSQDCNLAVNSKADSVNGRCSSDKSQEKRKKMAPDDSSIGESDMDTVTVADTFLESLKLTSDQQKEVISFITDDIKDLNVAQVIDALVGQLLGTSCSVRTMNAPRFNKFLQQLLAHYCSQPTSIDRKHALCEQAVQWARDRKSVHLRHELELTLMTLYYSTKQYKKAETIANALYSETKKLQDKDKTVKACLCLSQVYHAMGNISKARANITTAKTEALKIYTPPDMQGELDLQSGIMQVAEGKDMETAYSYFKEAATGFTSRKQRSRALKYMLLSKVMVNRAQEGEKAVRGQSHVQDIDEGVEAMLAITAAANRSSLADFKKTREQYGEHLEGDIVVASVLDDLYTKMMEKNLLTIVLPYERLQIVHIAEKIGLPREDVEKRLSQMILDKRINAQLDHRDDCLYIYGAEEKDDVYQTAISTLCQLDKTVSHLNNKVKKLL